MSHPQIQPQKSKVKKSLLLNLLLILLLCAVLYFLFFASLGWITRHGDDTKVPKVTGQDLRTVKAKLEGMGFDVKVDSTYEPDKKALEVLQQLPDVGDLVKNGRTLFLTVNKAAPPATAMPNLINLSYRSAILILKSNRLLLGDTSMRPDIAKGAILEQSVNGQQIRPGQMIAQGSRINLVIGDGLGNTEMNVPDVIGMAYPAAIATLNANNIQAVIIPVDGEAITDSSTALIFKQSPNAISDLGSPSRIREGDFVDIYIKQNPTQEEMDANRNAWRDHMNDLPGNDTSK